MELTFISGGIGLLDSIEPIWEELNKHHAEQSCHFKEHFIGHSFEKRKKGILNKAKFYEFHVGLVKAPEYGIIGYCLTSAGKNQGEIESIFVKAFYHGKGVGTQLMDDAMTWLAVKKIENIQAGVVFGNESAFSFYEKFGLFPQVTILKK